MHPELLNNSLFLRYYNQWLERPDSIVFAPIGEFLIGHGHLDEAIKICREGLKNTPNSVTGRMVLAKALIKSDKLDEADDELRKILSLVPSHTKAQKLRLEIELAAKTGAKVTLSEREVLSDDDDKEAKLAKEEIEEEEEEITAEYKMDPNEVREDEKVFPTWQTVTMAKIYSAQGHTDKAREIYRAILSRDPSNEAARSGLNSLGEASSTCPS